MSIFVVVVVVVVSVLPKASPKLKLASPIAWALSVWNSPNWAWVLVLKSIPSKLVVVFSALKVLVSTIFVVFVSNAWFEAPKSNWALFSNPVIFVSVFVVKSVFVVAAVSIWFNFISEVVPSDCNTLTVANSSLSRFASPWKNWKFSVVVVVCFVVLGANWVSTCWNWVKSSVAAGIEVGTEVVLAALILWVTLYSPKVTGDSEVVFMNVSILINI